jgi:hypothetical protein
MSEIHSCSYYCTRPACVLTQRDELRDKLEQQAEPVQRIEVMRLRQKNAKQAEPDAVQAEREACAQILDRNAAVCGNNTLLRDVLTGNALAIRARGQQAEPVADSGNPSY